MSPCCGPYSPLLFVSTENASLIEDLAVDKPVVYYVFWVLKTVY